MSATLKQMKDTIKKHNKKSCLLLSGSKATLASRIRSQPGLVMPTRAAKPAKQKHQRKTVTKDQRAAARRRARARCQHQQPARKLTPSTASWLPTCVLAAIPRSGIII